jgi:hypothetical protein
MGRSKGRGVPGTRVTSLDALGKALRARFEAEGPTLDAPPAAGFLATFFQKTEEPRSHYATLPKIHSSSLLMIFPVGVSGIDGTSRICDGRL